MGSEAEEFENAMQFLRGRSGSISGDPFSMSFRAGQAQKKAHDEFYALLGSMVESTRRTPSYRSSSRSVDTKNHSNFTVEKLDSLAYSLATKAVDILEKSFIARYKFPAELKEKYAPAVVDLTKGGIIFAIILTVGINLISNISTFVKEKFGSSAEAQLVIPAPSNPQLIEKQEASAAKKSIDPRILNDVAQSEVELPVSQQDLGDFGGHRPPLSDTVSLTSPEDLSDFGGQRPRAKQLSTRIFSNRTFILSTTCGPTGPNFWMELPSMGLNHEMNLEGYDAKGRRLFSQWLGSISDNFVGYVDDSKKIGQTAELRYITKYVPDDVGPDNPARTVKTVRVRLNRHQRSSFVACYRQAGLLPPHRSSAL